MKKEDFQSYLRRHAATIEAIKRSAHELHASVNQTYGESLPYSYHLDMVAERVMTYAHEVCACEADVLPLIFGAYYHDSIEDARLTYNDVRAVARQYLDEQQALMAAEIVYALTNDKGRTRAERAGENYYRGIRATPYAPVVKLADRLANTTYSSSNSDSSNTLMQSVYAREMPHFVEAITADDGDMRKSLPADMLEVLMRFGQGSQK